MVFLEGRKLKIEEQIRKLEEFAEFVIESLERVEGIDNRTFSSITAEFEKHKLLILTSLRPVEIDENPWILQKIQEIEEKLTAALEIARAKHKTRMEQEKASILDKILSLLNKIIER